MPAKAGGLAGKWNAERLTGLPRRSNKPFDACSLRGLQGEP